MTKQNQTNDNPNTTNNDQQQKPIGWANILKSLLVLIELQKLLKVEEDLVLQLLL